MWPKPGGFGGSPQAKLGDFGCLGWRHTRPHSQEFGDVNRGSDGHRGGAKFSRIPLPIAASFRSPDVAEAVRRWWPAAGKTGRFRLPRVATHPASFSRIRRRESGFRRAPGRGEILTNSATDRGELQVTRCGRSREALVARRGQNWAISAASGGDTPGLILKNSAAAIGVQTGTRGGAKFSRIPLPNAARFKSPDVAEAVRLWWPAAAKITRSRRTHSVRSLAEISRIRPPTAADWPANNPSS